MRGGGKAFRNFLISALFPIHLSHHMAVSIYIYLTNAGDTGVNVLPAVDVLDGTFPEEEKDPVSHVE